MYLNIGEDAEMFFASADIGARIGASGELIAVNKNIEMACSQDVAVSAMLQLLDVLQRFAQLIILGAYIIAIQLCQVRTRRHFTQA